jgi:hypothetical protein
MLKYVKTNKIYFYFQPVEIINSTLFQFSLKHLVGKLLEACADKIYEQVKIETFSNE